MRLPRVASLLAAGLALASWPVRGTPVARGPAIPTYRELEDAREAGRAEHERVLLRVVELAPFADLAWYDLACLRSLRGDAEGALAALERALETGWANAEHAGRDRDLAPLATRPQFKSWLRRVAASEARVPEWRDPGPCSAASLEAAVAKCDACRAVAEATQHVIGFPTLQRMTRECKAREAACRDRFTAAAEGLARDDAEWETIRALTKPQLEMLDAATLGEIMRRVDAFVAREPMSHVQSALLVRAEARYASDCRSMKDMEDYERLLGILERDLLQVAASGSDAEPRERALARVVGLVHRRGDRAGARQVYLSLIADAKDAAEVRRRVREDQFGRDAYWRVEPLPNFVATTIDGKAITPASLRGKMTLLTFWGSWCGPCVREVPTLQALHREAGDRLQIVGIGMHDDSMTSDRLTTWCAEKGVTWPQVYEKLEPAGPMREAFGISFFPTHLLLDAEGKVVATDLDLMKGHERLARVMEFVPKG